MRAGLRLGMAIAAAGLALAGVPAFAQDAPPETASETPATDSVGPRELQNFSLQGTVTRQAEPPEPAPAAPAPQRAPAVTPGPSQSTDRSTATIVQPPRVQPSTEPSLSSPVAATETARPTPPSARPAASSSVTVNLPPPSGASGAADSRPAASFDSGLAPEAAGSLASQRGLPLLPWFLAAVVLGAGGAFLFWRKRSREAYAGGPQFDLYAAPEPAPAPKPAPPAPAHSPTPASPKPVGIVTTRLRPWLELNFEPIRCVVDEEKVTFEFELGLFNSGSAPARDVLIEATLFNAGPEQEREIETFFAKPVGHGQRIAAIPPLQRMNLRTEVSAPRAGLQLFEIGGRHVIVPLIGFNALYKWGVSDGQTSQSFLLGRDTKGEKLAPFRMDLGPRVFRGLAARPLPQFVRN